MLKEFKAFISKGNVIDLAVGVIIGTAFSAIVTSIVKDVVMPLVGIIIGGIDFTKLTATIGDASINYGLFIQAVVNFLIIAITVFLFVKLITKLRKPKAEAPAVVVVPRDEQLLEEIRDLLKEQNGRK